MFYSNATLAYSLGGTIFWRPPSHELSSVLEYNRVGHTWVYCLPGMIIISCSLDNVKCVQGFAPNWYQQKKILAVETFILPAHAICQRCNTGSTLLSLGNHLTATDSGTTIYCFDVSWADFAKMMVQFHVCTLICWADLIHKWLCLISLAVN